MKTLQGSFNSLAEILTKIISSIGAANKSKGVLSHGVIVNRATSKSNFLSVLLVGLYLVAAFCGFAQPTPCPSPPTSYTIDFQAGYTSFANQLDKDGDPVNNTYDKLLKLSIPPNSQVLKWNLALQKFDITTRVVFGSGWNPSTAGSTTLNPGEGAFLKLAQPLSITFTGTPRSTETPVTINTPPTAPPDKFYLLSRQVPCSAHYDDIVGSPPVNGTALYKWRGSLGDSGSPASSLNGYQSYMFKGSVWLPFVPVVNVGDTVFIGSTLETFEGTAFQGTGCTVGGSPPLANRLIVLTGGNVTYNAYTFTDINGKYVFNVTGGSCSVCGVTVSHVPDCGWTATCSGYTFQYVSGSLMGLDFGSTPPVSSLPDLSVQVYAIVPPHNGDPKRTPCCGDTMTYRVIYGNHCAANPAGATVGLVLSGPVSFASADTLPSGG